MFTLQGFGRIFPEAHGETKDLRAQWTLEETGLPYRVHALDHTGGELDGEAYNRISRSVRCRSIDDDGFVVAESAAVVLDLAEKAGKLIPGDVQGRTRVVQWCFAATSTVEPTFLCLDMIEIFDSGETARAGARTPTQQPTAGQGVPDRRRGRRRYGAIGSSIAVAAPGWWYTRWVAMR